MSYDTGNPIGSTDARDLYDNAENLDNATNGVAVSWVDRLGVARKSFAGMEADFQNFLISSGFQDLGAYGPGLVITARNQLIVYDGQYYRSAPATVLPYTTNGTWATDAPYFILSGDNALRQDLISIADTTIGYYRNAVNCNQYGGLQSALVDSDTVGKVIVVTDAQTISASVAVTGRALAAEYGAMITIASGQTLTINGPFSAGAYQVFAGTGVVTGLKEARPEWWGTNITPGTTDMTLAWQAAVDAAPTVYGSNIAYAINATRLLTIPGAAICGINIPANRRLILEPNTVMQAMPNASANSAIFGAYDVANISITGGILIGERATHTPSGGPSDEHGFGIDFRGVTDGKITNTTIKNCQGDGIYIGAGATGTFCNRIIIDKVLSDNNRRQGVSIVGSNNVKILNSTFSNTNGTAPQAGIDIESNSPSVAQNNILIDNCDIVDNAGSGIDILRGQNVTVSRCNITGNSYGHLIVGNVGGAASSQLKFIGNTYSGNTYAVFSFGDNVDNVLISNNIATTNNSTASSILTFAITPTSSGLFSIIGNHFYAHGAGTYLFVWGQSDALRDLYIADNTLNWDGGTAQSVILGNNIDFNNNRVYVGTGNSVTIFLYFAHTGKGRLRGNSFFNTSGVVTVIQTNSQNIVLCADNQFSQDITASGINIAMPTAGYWWVGEFVPDWSNADNGGWKRITNGSTHVIDVDWKAMSGAL